MCESQYEYTIKKCNYSRDAINKRIKWLNEIASEGWELVCVDTSTQYVSSGYIYGYPSYIFRRPIKYDTPDYNPDNYAK